MKLKQLSPLLGVLAGWHQMDALAEGKPYAQYWMSVSTNNMTIPGMSGADMGMLGGMMGRGMPGMGPQRAMLLQLNAPRQLPPSPEAAHDIPPGLNMGNSLPLLSPVHEKTAPRHAAREERNEPFERPKGRMLFYWGCGEKVRAGQPRVLDMSKAGANDFSKMMAGHQVARANPPSERSGWAYADWPNRDSTVEVPVDGSLQGGHFIHANYAPDIRFNLGEPHDFMAPVEFTRVQGGLADSIYFQWRAIPHATAYFAMAMAGSGEGGDTIFWSSSESPEPGWGLMDYLPNAEAKRLVQEKVVLAPETTDCRIPLGIFKDTQGATLQFIAYGNELNLLHPPKPADPKQPWNPIWSVKLRLKSTGMTMLGQEERQARGSRASRQGRSYTSEYAAPQRQQGGTSGYGASRQGRSYTSDSGAAPRGGEGNVLDQVNKIRGLIPW